MGVLKIPWPGMKIDSLFFEGSWVFFWIEQKTECKIIENQNHIRASAGAGLINLLCLNMCSCIIK